MKDRMALMWPSTTSRTWMAKAVGGPPGAAGTYTAAAGAPFARTGTNRWSRGRHARPASRGCRLRREARARTAASPRLRPRAGARPARSRPDVRTRRRKRRAMRGDRRMARSACVAVDWLERGPGAAERAVHAVGRALQQRCYSGGAPVQHVAQNEYRTLTRRETLQRGDEREPYGFTCDARSAGSPSAGGRDCPAPVRSTPTRVGGRSIVLARSDACDIHRQGTSGAAIEHVDADVGRDPV